MIYFSKNGSDWRKENRSREHIGVMANLGVQTEQGAKESEGNWWDLRY